MQFLKEASQFSWVQTLISGSVGFVTGAVGSLVAPWVQWAIEKRRTKLDYKRNLIKEWRSFVDNFHWDSDNFGESSVYAAMCPHMNPDTIRKFETEGRWTFTATPEGGRGKNLRKQWATDEITAIEKRWKLV